MVKDKPDNEAEEIITLISKLNENVVGDSSLTYLSDDQYDRILSGFKKLTLNIYNHRLVSQESHDRLDELTDVMTSLASLDFTKRATVDGSENHLDYIAIGLNLLSYQLAKQVEPMKLLKNFYDTHTEPILVVDANNNLLSGNTEALRRLAIEEKDIYMMPFSEVVSFNTIQQGEFGNNISATLKSQEGEIYDQAFIQQEFKNVDGRLLGYIYYGINDKKEKPTDGLKEVLENNPLDFNRIHHDISGPIRSMKGIIELGKINSNDSEALELFDLIEKCRKSIEVHFNDLFDMIFLKSIRLRYDDVSLNEVIGLIVSTFSVHPGWSRRKFNVSINPPDIKIYTNKKLLNSILTNLVSNAIKYSSKQENSYVGVRVVSDGRSGCIIEVSDNGQGISKENLPLIFRPHFRVSYEEEGKGLGLYIVEQAVKKLGGKITAESVLGEGTKFKVHLSDAKT